MIEAAHNPEVASSNPAPLLREALETAPLAFLMLAAVQTGSNATRRAIGGLRLAFLSMDIVRREQREPVITADGSSVRELAGIPSANATNQSLAEAIVPPASATIAHLHRRSEEIYLFTRGSGRMRLGDEERPVRAGDCVVIPPGVVHKLWSGKQEPLVLLCCCAPAYSHADTLLLEN
jgi:mannose-6-phosphate isomerase-like protein (cupin superfamily)